MMMRKALPLIAAGATLVTGMACGAAAVPTKKNLAPAVAKFLREKGDFCLGKYTWPISVSEHDRQGRSNDAVQLPVLEKLGLVTSSSPRGRSGRQAI